MTAWADMADKVLTSTLDIQRQFHLAAGDDIKMTMIFSVEVDVLARFDNPPTAGGYNVLNLIAADVFEKDGCMQALYQRFVNEHRL
jgi:hypothetical protein